MTQNVTPKGRLTNSPIQHVFVLMLENHSFDHLLGFSNITGNDAITRQPTKINGLTGKEYNEFNGRKYFVQTPATDPMPKDPGHEFQDTVEELCGQGVTYPCNQDLPYAPYPSINNLGFVANYNSSGKNHPTGDQLEDIMTCCDSAKQVPALYKLASEFAICDNWFSSLPGPTWPNRFFAMGASSAGFESSPSIIQIAKWELGGFPYPHCSIFDRLKDKKLPYRLYNDREDQFGKPLDGLLGGEVPIVAALEGINIFDVHSFKKFSSDLNSPDGYPYVFTFIEPNYGDVIFETYSGGSSQHPMDSLTAGDQLTAATYEAIRNSPIWDRSLLIITYDEHGGFYDHVAPPTTIPPGDGSLTGDLNTSHFNFKQLGVRVPAVAVSPWIPKNTIDHTLYDHTSMLATLESLFGLEPLTDRDKHANNLCHLFSRDTPGDYPKSLEVPMAKKVERKQYSPKEQEVLNNRPLPESGNLIGALAVAAKTEMALSDGSEKEKADILKNLESIKTLGQAKRYFDKIQLLLQERESGD